MNLRQLQQTTLDLLKSRYKPLAGDDPYASRLAASEGLHMAREIAQWWRAYQIEQYCRLTSAWLRQLGSFETEVAGFYEGHNVPAFIESAADAFLGRLAGDAHALTAALARTERALLRAKRGEPGQTVVPWPCSPETVLLALLRGEPADWQSCRGHYRVTVAREIRGLFVVEKVEKSRVG